MGRCWLKVPNILKRVLLAVAQKSSQHLACEPHQANSTSNPTPSKMQTPTPIQTYIHPNTNPNIHPNPNKCPCTKSEPSCCAWDLHLCFSKQWLIRKQSNWKTKMIMMMMMTENNVHPKRAIAGSNSKIPGLFFSCSFFIFLCSIFRYALCSFLQRRAFSLLQDSSLTEPPLINWRTLYSNIPMQGKS